MTEKLKMKTADMASENFEKLKALFPNCVTESLDKDGNPVRAIDKDLLMQEINSEVVEGQKERYQFNWPGKRDAIRKANAPTTMTLRPCKDESVDFDNTQNLYIEGDNLEVLKLLQNNYLGKVKMIYIDPPYNTGNDFVYNDNFKQDSETFLETSGMFDEDGNMTLQNFEKNSESNGRFHTDWLNMMYPRLKVARNLLSDDGVIFISIDENESHNLRKLCDEIYGPSNFLTDFVWSAGRKNDSKHVSVSHEYVLCYFKSVEYIKEHKIIWREKKQGLEDIYTAYDKLKKQFGPDIKSIEKGLKGWYKSLPDGHPAKDHSHYNKVDENGIFFASDISWPGGGGPKYQVLHPKTGTPVRIPSRGWITNEATMNEWIRQGKVHFEDNADSVPTIKAYLREHEEGVPYSVFYKDGRAASKRLAILLGDKVFENPKDEEVLQRIIQFCGSSEGDFILDFFSGSASTAHALFLANVEQQIKRKFILVQIPQIIDPDKTGSEKSKKVALNAVKLLDSINAPHNICEIGKERIRRAGKKIKEESGEKAKNLDIGFRVLKLAESNMNEVYYKPADIDQGFLDKLDTNIKRDRTPMDLLFQVMLECDLELSSKIEEREINGKKVFFVNEKELVACFDENIDEATITEIAKLKPYYFVMRDSSLATDNVADNFEQLWNAYSKDTIRKVL